MDDSLQHFGVLGMRWGVRRGRSSVTPSSSDHSIAAVIKKKKLHQMSNEELKTISARLELEQRYKSLNPGKVARGKKAADEVFSLIGKVSVAATTIAGAIVAGKKIYEAAKNLHS